MAPWVSSGHSENAMFEAVSISCMAMPTSHGKPPPPYDSGNGTAGQPASTHRRYALSKPVGRRDRAVGVAAAVLDVADPVERRELLGVEAARLLEQPDHRVDVGVLEAGEGRHLVDVGDVPQHETDVGQRRGVVTHTRDITDG